MDKLQKNQPNRSKPMKKWGKALDFFSYLAIIKANDARIASKKQKKAAPLQEGCGRHFYHYKMGRLKAMEYRIEKDSIGEREVPVDAYYGVQSLRGAENFHITGQKLQPEFINSMAEIKKPVQSATAW